MTAKAFAEHPGQRREVYEDRSLWTRTVDETLRFEPTGAHVARYVIRDYECYDTTVPAGSAMLLLFGAANRDPRRYKGPDTFKSAATTSPTSRSAKVCTTASARTLLAWKAG
jgi:cytochrome P450